MLGFRLAGAGGAIALAVAPDAAAVNGGPPIPVSAAPWAVSISTQSGSCSGSIIDATHVLTAAHCVFTDTGFVLRPSQVVVEAGISNNLQPSDTDARQMRPARTVRVSPGYIWSDRYGVPGNEGDDLAVLTVAHPFDLTGADVQAVALPSVTWPRPDGDGYELAGFGAVSPTMHGAGQLRLLQTTVLPPAGRSCGGGILCTSSKDSSPCFGDSGAGLVDTSSAPTLVGVFNATKSACRRGDTAYFANLDAAATRQFVSGTTTATPPSRWTTTILAAQHSDVTQAQTPIALQQHRSAAAVRVALSVPASWHKHGSGNRSFLWDPASGSIIMVAVYPGMGATQADFFADAEMRTVNVDIKTHAIPLRPRRVKLKNGGQALVLGSSYTHRLRYVSGGLTTITVREAVEMFYVFHDGVGWAVIRSSLQPVGDLDASDFEQSAKTLGFVEAGATHTASGDRAH